MKKLIGGLGAAALATYGLCGDDLKAAIEGPATKPVEVCVKNLRERVCENIPGPLGGSICSPQTLMDVSTGSTFDVSDRAFEQLTDGGAYIVLTTSQRRVTEVIGSSNTCQD